MLVSWVLDTLRPVHVLNQLLRNGPWDLWPYVDQSLLSFQFYHFLLHLFWSPVISCINLEDFCLLDELTLYNSGVTLLTILMLTIWLALKSILSCINNDTSTFLTRFSVVRLCIILFCLTLLCFYIKVWFLAAYGWALLFYGV